MSEIKPVYQVKRFDETGWTDVTQESYKSCELAQTVLETRILYPAADYEALENERDQLKQNLEDLQERFNGIKFIESELRKELTALESERNRRDEMRKALEAQMGISKKWQP